MTTTASPQTTSTLISRRDLRFLLHDWLGLEQLAERPAFAEQNRELYDDILDLAERIASEKFAPHNRTADEQEPYIDGDGKVVLIDEIRQALDAFYDAGLGGITQPDQVGGMALPMLLSTAVMSFFQAANSSTTSYVMLTAAAANLLLATGSPEQIDRFVAPMVEGRFQGTMCLSETQAGSSLSDITTRAEPQDDGTYRMFGTKMWISGGDHELRENIIHLVLGKTPGAPAGVKGISLFIVPRFLVGDQGEIGERNDIVLAGLNHKMGNRGSVNTVLGLGEGVHTPGGRAGAVAYLVGDEHRGLAYMFHMMNEARVGTGVAATATGYASYLKALRYARERLQGRPVAGKDPTTRQVPIIQHADVKRMLLAQKSYVEGATALTLYCSKLIDDERTLKDSGERRDAHLLLELLTPIAKSWPSQWCLEANSLAIQIHGGYGYARDYGVEQHYRDNRVNAILEGTHGIQALDLLGRKVTMEDGAALTKLATLVESTIERALALGGDAAAFATALHTALGRLVDVTAKIWRDGIDVALANASIYLEAAGHIVISWIWLEQLLVADGKTGEFYDGKRQTARYFFRYELPKTGPQLDLLASRDQTTIAMEDAWFGT